MLITAVASKAMKLDREASVAFKNSVVLTNSGNFGLPVSQLVFQSNQLGLSIQIIVAIFQNMLTYTYGLLNALSVANGRKGTGIWSEWLKLPIIYALLLAIALRLLNIRIPAFVWHPIENVSHAFIAMALVTLGAQLAYLKLTRISAPLLGSIICRLMISPLVSLLLIMLLGLEGTTAQALFIASAYPTSRSTALFALEYNDGQSDYAAQTVFVTTLLSSLTVTAVIFISRSASFSQL